MKIPTHDEAMAAVEDTQNATALDIFVYEEEPFGPEGDIWRDRLAKVVNSLTPHKHEVTAIRYAIEKLHVHGHAQPAQMLQVFLDRLEVE